MAQPGIISSGGLGGRSGTDGGRLCRFGWRRRRTTGLLWTLALTLGCAASLPTAVRAQEMSVRFLSTQFAPLDEAAALRHHAFDNFDGSVHFQPYDSLAVIERLAEGENAPVDLVAGVHGDLEALSQAGLLQPIAAMSGLDPERGIPASIAEAARLGTDRQMYIPWMQATYLMAADRRALAYLPVGADLERLTYDQFRVWAAAVDTANGHPMLGFPAGPRGLMPRFIQGFLYPSFTGAAVTTLRDPEVVPMWEYMRRLWQHVNVRSLTYNQMHEPLLSGDVWIAWDHVARLLPAIRAEPDRFVVFPAPIGPHGRGALIVVIGLGIPSATQNVAPSPGDWRIAVPRANRLIGHLTAPDIEAGMISALGVFPIAEASRLWPVDPALISIADAVATQVNDPDTILGVLPPRLGGGTRTLSLAYMLLFTQIVLRDADIYATSRIAADDINSLFDQDPHPCWLPDPATEDPCRVPPR
ncbi:MAG: extracellular solute-binding protein [Rhodospirillaceae bacterium]|nr:extracellular solute-binding protein [Rhodospirillaceae bacterium]